MTGRAGVERDNEELRRCVEFATAIESDCADRVEPIEGGTAVLTPSLPLVWSRNYVLFERPGIDPGQMAEICERVLGALGLGHRAVHLSDPAEGERLVPEFERLGWETDRDLYMALRSRPAQPAVPGPEVSRQGLPAELVRELSRENEFLAQQPEPLEEVVEQLLERERRRGEATGDRWYVAELEGRPAATATLLARAGVGQIEMVNTLESARKRGLARAVLLAAIEDSLGEGNEITFLIADAEDWPRGWYERLGFAGLGVMTRFRKRA
ncbi:MAG: GNAT family N-acetyltransferase [Actinobacteria bacterium]|nr:GNAT family N-acetyltransferase [Actinomycetota bacterium]